jgi:CheY-like chemotaxis protein
LQDILAPLGFITVEADTGQVALTQALALKPDLILMDLVMPQMNGLEATRQIRCQPALKNIKIIAISASATLDARQECLAAGCDDFIAKPFAIDALLAKIVQYLPLDWVFESTPAMSALPVSNPPKFEDLNLLPQSELIALLELTRMGDLYSLQTQFKQLKTEFPFLNQTITQFEQLAKQFKLTEIETLLTGVLDEQK